MGQRASSTLMTAMPPVAAAEVRQGAAGGPHDHDRRLWRLKRRGILLAGRPVFRGWGGSLSPPALTARLVRRFRAGWQADVKRARAGRAGGAACPVRS